MENLHIGESFVVDFWWIKDSVAEANNFLAGEGASCILCADADGVLLSVSFHVKSLQIDGVFCCTFVPPQSLGDPAPLVACSVDSLKHSAFPTYLLRESPSVRYCGKMLQLGETHDRVLCVPSPHKRWPPKAPTQITMISCVKLPGRTKPGAFEGAA